MKWNASYIVYRLVKVFYDHGAFNNCLVNDEICRI